MWRKASLFGLFRQKGDAVRNTYMMKLEFGGSVNYVVPETSLDCHNFDIWTNLKNRTE